MFLSIPATIALMIGSNEIVSALFGYGSFNEVSVENSANALFFFSLGLPAFALIKVFSSFFFANHDTKTPFYISLISVILNITVSIYYFRNVGFIIIPIATSISSWFNSLILYIYLSKNKLFSFNKTFIKNFSKIIFSSILMGFIFNYLVSFFDTQLMYDYEFKLFYLILVVILTLILYLLVSFLIKAFNSKDLKLKY
jgi:putative peptidoglycan lipid II flippase